MTVVSNAGPLIALAQIDQLNLSEDLFAAVSIPVAVHHEMTVAAEGLVGSDDVRSADWIEVIDVGDRMAVEMLRERLDLGESEAVIDDLVASSRGFPALGGSTVRLAGRVQRTVHEIVSKEFLRLYRSVYRTGSAAADGRVEGPPDR